MFRPARSARLALLVALLAIVASACAGDRPTLGDSGASREVADDPQSTSLAAGGPVTLRLAVDANWDPDPAAAGPATVANRVVAGLVFEGLTRIDRSGNVQPALAERWFVSDDRLAWTFVLPVDAADNDGRRLTARDVKASLERLADRGAAEQIVVQLSPISGWDAFVAGESGGAAGIVAVDDRTLVVTLDEPFEPLAEVLAEPAFGVVGLADDGAFGSTGAYRYGATEFELVAVDPAAPVARIDLVPTPGPDGEPVDMADVDWAVVSRLGAVRGAPATTLRQPLDVRMGLVVRLADPAARQAVLASLNPAELALDVPYGSLAVAPAVASRPDALPASVDVVLPDGPLAALAPELDRQFAAAGVTATVTVLDRSDFAEAVSGGEALVFPMVQAGLGFARSVVVATAGPEGDDLFGAAGIARAEIVDEIVATVDPVERAALIDALERQLAAEYLWLPVANAEVRIGLSERMAELRVLPDGTFDLSGFGVT